MIHNLLTLLVPDSTFHPPGIQATYRTPPADSPLVERTADCSGVTEVSGLKFMAGVVGDACGFAGVVAACWMGLQLLQNFL